MLQTNIFTPKRNNKKFPNSPVAQTNALNLLGHAIDFNEFIYV